MDEEQTTSGEELPPPPAAPPQPSLTVPTGGAVSLKPAEFFPDTKVFEGSTIHPNTAQQLILTTEDKLRNYLNEYARAGAIRMEWLAPLGLTIAIGTCLLTSKFETALGISAAFWAALFCLGLIAAIGWLIVSLVRLMAYWKSGSVEALIRKIKNLPNS